MTFTSPIFYLFLPVVYLIFYWTPDRWRWLVLLIASYGFYAFFWAKYLLVVLLMVTAISYVCGLRIAAHQEEAERKRWLWIGILGCMAILALMKFLEAKSHSLTGLNVALSRTFISVGVSYFTFQAISYLADVYLEIEEPEHHCGHFALYLAFFPKLLQGPIERAADLLPQLKRQYQFDYDAMRFGVLLFTWGLFKKLVIADRFALYTNPVFNNVHNYIGLPLLIAIYAYALQIYFDFSAYTDMARGVGRMFGISLTENFNSPYMATSIADFWRKWHISFSRWILDYIFKPLQMGWRNWGQSGTALALIITFLVSGIWHGVTWGFVLWGLFHGVYLAASAYYRPYQKLLHKWLGLERNCFLKAWQIFITFNLVSFAWIFFRSKNLGDAFYLISHLGFTGDSSIRTIMGAYQIYLLILFLILNLCITNLAHVKEGAFMMIRQRTLVRWVSYALLLTLILLFRVDDKQQFIYFQF